MKPPVRPSTHRGHTVFSAIRLQALGTIAE
jgi:hypothetical protein